LPLRQVNDGANARLYLAERSLLPGNPVEMGSVTMNDSPRVFLPPPLIFMGLLASGLFLDGNAVALGVIQMGGIFVAIMGLALIAIALAMFRSGNTRAEPWKSARTLVEHGIYRVTRNPMYLGMALLSLGVALFCVSLLGVVMAMLAALIVDRAVIDREEAYLSRRFGAAYLAYRCRVRRWL
jgi:protein-S-isoprenylcysteine O-methyltransferase Ste14